MIIGLTGKMRSGKSTFGLLLADELQGQIASFAAPIKEIAHSITHPLSGARHADKEIIRPLYQAIGETMKGLYGRSYWLTIFEQRHARAIDSEDDYIIIDDVRFPFEARWIQKLGGKVIKIMRPGMDEQADGHVSETMVDKVLPNVAIRNTGSIEQLEALARDFATTLP